MAKVIIAGSAIVITSALKLDDIALIEKYNPSALVLKGGEDGKEEIFRIATGDYSEIGSFGICFSEESRNGGYASVTMMTSCVAADGIKEVVADNFGSALSNLNKIEKTLPDVIDKIKADRKTIIDNIEIIQ